MNKESIKTWKLLLVIFSCGSLLILCLREIPNLAVIDNILTGFMFGIPFGIALVLAFREGAEKKL